MRKWRVLLMFDRSVVFKVGIAESKAKVPLTPHGKLNWYKRKAGARYHAHSAPRGPEIAIATERAMVEGPREVCICIISYL